MTKHTPTIDEWQAAVNACETLEQLLETLIEALACLPGRNWWPVWNRICEMPKLGGDRPADTDGVWSWDETRLLVSDGMGGFMIVDRTDR